MNDLDRDFAPKNVHVCTMWLKSNQAFGRYRRHTHVDIVVVISKLEDIVRYARSSNNEQTSICTLAYGGEEKVVAVRSVLLQVQTSTRDT